MIIRRTAWRGQQRVDVPHLRALESSVAADFDSLAGLVMAGNRAVVVKGFELAVPTLPAAADTLQLLPGGGVLLHPLASESGTVFWLPEDEPAQTLDPETNTKIEGSFTAESINYVGLDLRLFDDPGTQDVVQFLDSLSGQEIGESVALARTLDYKIVISTVDFSLLPHVCPIAKVTTDPSNSVIEIEDARNLMWRLGSGGSNPQPTGFYTWPQDRTEGAASTDSVNEPRAFKGGDRAIGSLKEWMDAMMTRVWELGGGEHWYSGTADRDVKIVYGVPPLSNGDNFDWDLGTTTLDWQSISILFSNSTASTNVITDGTMSGILDGECLYVDLERHNDGAALTMQKADWGSVGLGDDPPGSRLIIAWRIGDIIVARDKPYEVGRTFNPVASPTVSGTVKLNAAAANPDDPFVISIQTNGTASITATGGNAPGFTATGNGTGTGLVGNGGASGHGVRGNGGASGGRGGWFIAQAGNDAGVRGEGHGTGAGGHFFSGANAASYGVIGEGSAFDAGGVYGLGIGDGNGVTGVAGSGTGSGVIGQSSSNAVSFGVWGQATDPASGGGVLGSGGARGVVGSGSTYGVVGTGTGASGIAGFFENNSSQHRVLVGDGSIMSSYASAAASTAAVTPDANGDAFTADTSDSANGRSLAYFISHKRSATNNRDGVAMFSEKIADGDVDILFGRFVDNGFVTPELRLDLSGTSLTPTSDGGLTLGGPSARYRNAWVQYKVDFNTTNDNPPTITSSSAVRNALYARNTPKGWAYIKIETSGLPTLAGAASVVDGFNVDSVQLVDDSGGRAHLEVVWSEPFSSTNYIAIATVEISAITNTYGGSLALQPTSPTYPTLPKTADTTYFVGFNAIDGAVFDLANLAGVDDVWVHVVAFGVQ